ncbi:prepilin-type N-terminal cleavage/methylation domain-containing protein [Clostridium sp. AM58-1XD]|nr:prepilin-type N-terminal cleavage/methylation domain-containing protein [Clostridium sp. AM58-1XD]
MEKDNRGFSLIELIIAVAILVVLTGMLVPSLLGKIQEARRAKCVHQRDNLVLIFNLASVDHDWEDCKDITELKNDLGGKDPVDYLIENGYCDEKEAVCPVFHTKYELDYAVIKGVKSVEFLCGCNSAEKGYLAMAGDITEKGDYIKKSTDRKKLIEEIYNQRGSLLEVSSGFKNGTIAEGMNNLYWRPYYLKDGTIVMYAASGNTASHAGWGAYLVYVNGEIYESTKVGANGKPATNSVSSFYTYTDADSLKDNLSGLGFEKAK